MVLPHEGAKTGLAGKRTRPSGSGLKQRHSALLVVHLGELNHTPRALIGAVSDPTEHAHIAFTGPSLATGSACSMWVPASPVF